ncbi:hypothetical protein V6N13_044011 [Hibiscus sabdariffa]|uniref:NPH3 domain-containing protein n=1 Tax=Hibiscus sabdariffa TaxID=183260 RepID=A0ABR2RGX3_9ROSI
MAADKPNSKGQAWFCATGLPSDIIIEVDDMTFHLHKFPLISKSRKLDQLIEELGRKPSTATVAKQKQPESQTEIEEEEETEEYQDEGDRYQLSLQGFPGGSDTFETAAKFCYGVKIDLSSSTVVPLRCAAEFLEMIDEYSEDNLISKTERFLSQSVFKSLKESIKALKSCESVMTSAESLGVVQRLMDSIVSRASSVDPTPFGWPVNDGAIEAKGASTQSLWNGIETGLRRKAVAQTNNVEAWFEDLALLSLPLFKRFILTLKGRGLSPEVIESCLMCYAKKYIPGTSRSNRKPSTSSAAAISESEQRELLETIISNLPLETTCSSTATRFLFGLLRTSNILNASESNKAALEKKIGFQLEQATLDDLLIPSYSYLNETLYDVDCIERILGYFLDVLEERNAAGIEAENEGNDDNVNIISSSRLPAVMIVGKLIDGYLSEIASDANLKPEKFYNLAISLPDQARNFDDGLYRAVDVFLKAHPWIPESEREKICGVLNCQKLTLEACTHAAQNERLPLRAVVQVLFFEQLQLRHAIAGTLLAAETAPMNEGRLSEERREDDENEEGEERVAVSRGEEGRTSSRTWRAAVRENQVLRVDMDSMRTRVHQLEKECSTMKKVIQKIEKEGPGGGGGGGGWRGSLNKRFGCKFKTQVCDSHESTVAETRRGRHHHRP